MKNPYEVLRMKEQELTRVKGEVEALRVAAKLLDHEDERSPANGKKEDLRQLMDLP